MSDNNSLKNNGADHIGYQIVVCRNQRKFLIEFQLKLFTIAGEIIIQKR